LLGAVLVCIAARWRHGGGMALRYALFGILVGGTLARLLEPTLARVVVSLMGSTFNDPQGAIAFSPTFQVGLYVSIWVAAFTAVGWLRFGVGLAALAVTQAAGLSALYLLASDFGLTAHVRDVRGWAVAAPLLILAAVVTDGRTRH
jgi:hypothetical protein